jgi:hypothetical protein
MKITFSCVPGIKVGGKHILVDPLYRNPLPAEHIDIDSLKRIIFYWPTPMGIMFWCRDYCKTYLCHYCLQCWDCRLLPAKGFEAHPWIMAEAGILTESKIRQCSSFEFISWWHMEVIRVVLLLKVNTKHIYCWRDTVYDGHEAYPNAN